MLYALLFLPLAIALVALQTTVLNQITLAGGHLDIITISLVLLTLYGRYELALLAAVIIAPLVDALSGLPLGISVIPLLSIILLARWGGRAIFGARLGWPIIVIFLSTLLAGGLLMAELALIGWQLPWNAMALRILLPTAFLNAMAALAIYLPIIIISERRDYH